MIYIRKKETIMAKSPKAKVFMSGRSQAVRIPAEFRFTAKELYIRRTPGGDVILSPKPERKSLKEIYALLDEAGVPDDFMAGRDMRQAEEREIL
jgi:antitoxin VapB